MPESPPCIQMSASPNVTWTTVSYLAPFASGTTFAAANTMTAGTPVHMASGAIVTYDLNFYAWARPRLTTDEPDEAELDEMAREEMAREREERRQRQEEQQRRHEERVRQRQQAQARGRELLLSLLDERQRASYELTEQFDLIGSATGNRYRITPGANGNVLWLENDQVVGRLCAHPAFIDGHLPNADVALGQLLALTTDEYGWLAMANVHAGRRPDIPTEATVATPEPDRALEGVRAALERVEAAAGAA